MNQYETVFILTPVLSDVQMKEAVEKFKGIRNSRAFLLPRALRLSMKRTGACASWPIPFTRSQQASMSLSSSMLSLQL